MDPIFKGGFGSFFFTTFVLPIALSARFLKGVLGGNLTVVAVGTAFQGDFVSLEATVAQVFGPTLFLFCWIDFLFSRISFFFSRTFCRTSSTESSVGVFPVDFRVVLATFAGVVADVDFLFRGVLGFGICKKKQ